jgi:Glycosyl transferase family 2/Sulfotransferase family
MSESTSEPNWPANDSPTAPPQQRPVVVYLGGFGRSGSTLLERILGGIPGWVNVGELVDLPRSVYVHQERCGCGKPFLDCPFWSAVGERAYGSASSGDPRDSGTRPIGWHDEPMQRLADLRLKVARQRTLPQLLALARGRSADSELAERVQEYQAGYGRIYRAIAEVSGADVIVDASKGPAHGLALGVTRPGHPDTRNFELRMINLVRDPRGVAYSWSRRQSDRPHSGDPESGESPSKMWRISPHRSAAQWAALQSEMFAIGQASGITSVRVRYEDLVASPRSTIESVVARLGLGLGPDDLAHVENRTVRLESSHGLSGNPGRFASGTIQLRPDHEWTLTMPPGERLVVTTATAPWLLAYGYPLSGPKDQKDPDQSRELRRPQESHRQGEERTVTSPANPSADDLPLVSVVIPTRGRPELLRDTLASVVAQDYAGRMEILISHDQEDPDPTLEDYSRPDRTVRSVTNGGTPGLAGGRNFGIRNTSGQIVASCDDDDLWHPDKIRKQVARLQSDPGLIAVGTGIRLMMGDRDVDWPGSSPVITHQRLLGNRVKELHSSTLAMWRTSFAKAGEYDEELPHGYGEDYDWLLRASRVGKVGVVNEILADIRKDVPSWFRGKARNTADALEYMLAKHQDFITYPPGHARILGQIAYARATAGERGAAMKSAGKALRVYPAAPHAWLGLVTAATGVSPQRVLGLARTFGRGVS